MVKSIVFIILGLLTFGICFLMFIVGSTSSHLSELTAFALFPLPLGLIFLVIGIVGLAKKVSEPKNTPPGQ